MALNTYNYRIDNKVITAMLLVSFVFLLVMAFRYKNTENCPEVDFSFRTANKFDLAYENEKVYFSSEVKTNANDWEWDFGDKSPADKHSGPYLSHEFASPGVYTVRLTINGKCQQVRNISIGRREKTINKLFLRPVWPAGAIFAGKEYYFGDSTSGANSWSWYFDKDETKRTKQNITYQFTEPGEYKVILVVNDDLDNGKAEKVFSVLAPPKINSPVIAGNNNRQRVDIPNNPQVDPNANTNARSLEDLLSEQSKVPTLGEASLKAYILDINGNGQTMLRKYLKNGNCNFVFNGRSITMDQLKENMAEHAKNGKSLSAKQELDPKENYIKTIEITAELNRKKRIIGSKERNYPN
jgi:PKD repeat protein